MIFVIGVLLFLGSARPPLRISVRCGVSVLRCSSCSSPLGITVRCHIAGFPCGCLRPALGIAVRCRVSIDRRRSYRAPLGISVCGRVAMWLPCQRFCPVNRGTSCGSRWWKPSRLCALGHHGRSAGRRSMLRLPATLLQ